MNPDCLLELDKTFKNFKYLTIEVYETFLDALGLEFY